MSRVNEAFFKCSQKVGMDGGLGLGTEGSAGVAGLGGELGAGDGAAAIIGGMAAGGVAAATRGGS